MSSEQRHRDFIVLTPGRLFGRHLSSTQVVHANIAMPVSRNMEKNITSWYALRFLVLTLGSSFGRNLSCAQGSAQQNGDLFCRNIASYKTESRHRLQSRNSDVHGKNKLLAFPWNNFNAIKIVRTVTFHINCLLILIEFGCEMTILKQPVEFIVIFMPYFWSIATHTVRLLHKY